MSGAERSALPKLTLNVNRPALAAVRQTRANAARLDLANHRLATGRRINRAADDPGGLRAAIGFDQDEAGVRAARFNAARAAELADNADAALAGVGDLLLELGALVSESANDAGLSGDQREALQRQADHVLLRIDRVAAGASYKGKPLLRGGGAAGRRAADQEQTLGLRGFANGANNVALFRFAFGPTAADRPSDLLLREVTTATLGSDAVALAELRGHLPHALTGTKHEAAAESVREATRQVARLRGRIGAFRKYVADTARTANGVMLEQTAAAASGVRDTDFAAEMAEKTRAQILLEGSTRALQASNRAPERVLELVRNI